MRKHVGRALEAHRGDLQKVIASDQLDHHKGKQSNLRNEAVHILKRYENKFHSVGFEILRGVGSKAGDIHPYISIGAQFVDSAVGITRILEATDEFCERFEGHLSQVAAKVLPDDARLERTFAVGSFSSTEAPEVIEIMARNQVIINHNLVANGCARLEEIDFGKYLDRKYLIQVICSKVQAVVQGDHSPEIEELKSSLTNFVTHSIMRMINREILNPISSFIASKLAGNLFADMEQAKLNLLHEMEREAKREEARRQPEDKHFEGNSKEPPSTEPEKEKPSKPNKPKEKKPIPEEMKYKPIKPQKPSANAKQSNAKQEPYGPPKASASGNKETYGPQEPFHAEFSKACDEIDKRPISQAEKAKAKEQLHKAHQEINRMVPVDKKQLYEKINKPYKTPNIFERLNPFHVADTQAAEGEHQASGIGSCLGNAECAPFVKVAAAQSVETPLKNIRLEKQREEIAQSLRSAIDKSNAGSDTVMSKYLDQSWIIAKHSGKLWILKGKEQFAGYFPNKYEKMAGINDAAGVAIKATVNWADGKLHQNLGDNYDFTKKILGAFAAGIESNAPEIVKDGIYAFTLGGIDGKVGGAVFEAAGGTINKMKGKFGKQEAEYIYNKDSHYNEGTYATKDKINTDYKVGDYGNPKVMGPVKLLPTEVPKGRIDYRSNFLEDLENFEPGSSKLHHGPLKEDLYLVNYHDGSKNLGFGKDERTISWATHMEVKNRMPTMEEVHQHLALVKPEWGVRDTISMIKIPKGTDTAFISGRALEQMSIETGHKFKGGGYQVRFRDFDEKWIIDTKPLEK